MPCNPIYMPCYLIYMPPKEIVKIQVKGNAKKYSEYLTEEFRLNNHDVKLSGSKIREIATKAMGEEVFKKT